MVDNDAPEAWPIWTPGAWLAAFIKGITKHCYTQNIKALGLMVSEKKICFMFSPIITLWGLSVAIGPLAAVIFMFESVDGHTHGCTDARTPARWVYYKLTL